MKSRRLLYCATSFALLPLGQAWGQTYYVSPTGNDNNSGTSPNSPWQSLSKVDSTNFAPGSQILFQAGGNWYGQQLSASSSGTPSDPITYSSYGAGPNPTFWGSVIVPASSFEPVAGEPNTYFYPTTTPVNAFLVNHQFTDNANLVSNQTTDAGNISYVESTPNSNYYDPDGATPGLYVNTGGPVKSSNVYTAAIQDNVVFSNYQSNLVFNNLTVDESAKSGGGYGFTIQGSTNVQVLNSTSIAAGKHAFGALDSTGVLGENLNASYLMPDQGNGGATAFVSYADYNFSNTTSQWINDTFTNPNGPYPAFITHATPNAADPTPIASVLVKNMVADEGIAISTAGNEQVNIIGGQVTNGSIDMGGSNTTVNGVLLTGPSARIDVDSGGTGNVIENTIINGATPNWEAGIDGAISDAAQGTVIRFNTIVLGQAAGTLGAAIGLESNTTNTQIYGNIIDAPYAALFQRDVGTPSMNAFDNLFAGTTNPQVIFFDGSSPDSPITGLPTTISASELFGDPGFLDLAGGNLALQPNSIAAYVFDPTTDEYVMYDIYNNVRPYELASLGAIQETAPNLTCTWTNASNNGLWDSGASSNWNNGVGTVVYTDQSTVLFNDSNGGNYAVTLNSTVSPSWVVVNNSLGNYIISGTGAIAGAGALTKSGSGTLTLSTANSYSGGTFVYGGTLLIDPTSTPATTSALPAGGVFITGGTLQLASGVTAGSGPAPTSSVNITSLSITGNGVLDVNNNHIIITYGSSDPIATIVGYLKAGYNGGAWNGPGGIDTSAPLMVNGLKYGVGYADGNDHVLAGLSSGQIEVAYTLLGDANLDGLVNGSDFNILAANFNQSVTGWDQGDFNYDGLVNASDFNDLAANFNQGVSGADVSAGDVAALDAFATAIGLSLPTSADVPDPATGSLLLIAGAGLLTPRRRKQLP
jgi:autotransporter-associated beta strand protein